MSQPVTLLHLSEVRFGPNHSFVRPAQSPDEDEEFDTLLARLKDDLQSLERDHKLRPDVVVLSGDLTEKGKKPEFNDLLKFSYDLTEHLKLSRRRVVIIPGDHDINCDLCESYFNKCAGDEKPPKPPFWPKWEHYASFFWCFYKDCRDIKFTEDEPWTLFEMPDLKLVVAGLNSTMAESHRHDDHYGYVGEAQRRWFAEKLKQYKQQGWLRIGVLHHSIQHSSGTGNRILQDFNKLKNSLVGCTNLFLDGHIYDSRLSWLDNKTPIFSAGSVALKREVRPDETPNQYQIIQLWHNGFRRWVRSYDPYQKRWITYSGAIDGDNEQSCEFDNVQATFNLISDSNDFVSLVKDICCAKGGRNVDPISADLPVLKASVVRKQDHFYSTEIIDTEIIGISEQGVDEHILENFFTVFRRYHGNWGIIFRLVYGGTKVFPELVERALEQGVFLQNLTEYRGYIDYFRLYVQKQTQKLEADPDYPLDHYTPQQMRYYQGDKNEHTENALNTIQDWFKKPYEWRFVLILGNVGTGKTFLLRELAYSIANKLNDLTPILIQMNHLEKVSSLNSLVARHLEKEGMKNFNLGVFLQMLKDGYIALLFDGFHELPIAHLKILKEAAIGNAKVVAASRIQYSSEHEIGTTLEGHRERLPGYCLAYLPAQKSKTVDGNRTSFLYKFKSLIFHNKFIGKIITFQYFGHFL